MICKQFPQLKFHLLYSLHWPTVPLSSSVASMRFSDAIVLAKESSLVRQAVPPYTLLYPTVRLSRSLLYIVYESGWRDSYVVWQKFATLLFGFGSEAQTAALWTVDCGMWVTLWAISTHELWQGRSKGGGEERGRQAKKTHLMADNHDRALTNSVDLL